MFNPAQLKIVRQGVDKDNYDGFVGIRHNQDGKSEFCLPFGFESFPVKKNEEINKLFFSLYKTFKNFQLAFSSNSNYWNKDIDGFVESSSKFDFISKDDIPVTLFSKISNIESILSSYDELRIFSLVSRPKRTERINYAHIDKYLHQAVFLKNNVPFIDEMVLPQPILEYSITDLIQMYCYVIWEIKRQLNEDKDLPNEIISQAKTFHEINLLADSSLFTDNHDYTIELLRLKLNDIDRKISLKNDDFWHFFMALECFLYDLPEAKQDDQILWGITNFSPVWEDMCTVYMYEKDWKGVWYADNERFSNKTEGRFKIYLDENYKNPFIFRLGRRKRYMRPDVVRLFEFNFQEWFDKRFNLRWLSGFSCRIGIKSPDFLNAFNNFDWIIKQNSSGMRQKNERQTSHIYTPISEHKMQKFLKHFEKNIRRNHKPPEHIVVDFKYTPLHSYYTHSLSSKIKRDITKQLTYELAIKLNELDGVTNTSSQFCIPYYDGSNGNKHMYEIVDNKIDKLVTDNGIDILRISFSSIQEVYFSHSNRNKEI